MRDVIAINRGLVVIPAAGHEHTQLAASLQAELMNLGFIFDAPAFAAASKAPRQWLVAYHEHVIPHLRQRLGAARAHRPFYVNFPRQVMEMSHLELFLNACAHYLSDGRWEPPQDLQQRGVRFEHTQFKTVRLVSEAEFRALFTRLVSINQSLTDDDKRALEWFVATYGKGVTLPETVPFKETLCILAARGLDVPVKAPTDVLRIAVHLSGGDISLPGVPKPDHKPPPRGLLKWWADQQRAAARAAREKFKFRKFKRPERRRLLALLEKTGADVTEMQKHLGRWLRLGEVLHPGELAARFPRSAEAFLILRNQSKGRRVRTFGGRVNLAFTGDWRKGVDLLATRPGEFARKLDWMLRSFDPAHVLRVFERIGPHVSAKVLLELYNHFAARAKAGAPRAILIKGQRSKMKTLPPLPPLPPDLVQGVGNTILEVMRKRIAALPPMGRVWLDQRLRQVPVPFAMRSVNTSVRTYVRGTRIPYRRDAKAVRAFLHWFDEDGEQDLDLSAALYDADLKLRSHVSFTNLKDNPLNCCHSGDIRHRKGACAEYVDLDVRRCLDAGVRYVIVSAFNYNARPMHTVKDCVFGLMEREHPQANEIFVPKTISNCMALANEGTAVVACVIDLEQGDYIWADIESDRSLATVENTASRSLEVLRSLVEGTRMSVYDHLRLHAQVRGTLVDDPRDADLVLPWEDFVTDYAKSAQYMGF